MHSQGCKKLAVLCDNDNRLEQFRQLAARLTIPLVNNTQAIDLAAPYLLTFRDGVLVLLTLESLKQQGLYVDINHRPGEQLSWPIAKQGALAQALGKKTKTIIDATAGWGQEALAMFRMGYDVTCIERSPVMAELLQDGFNRLATLDWVQRLNLTVPNLVTANAIEILPLLTFVPDCIYLDPMFPPKRKKSALAKKEMTVLRDLAGDDVDKHDLFLVALATAGKRVVVKSPDYAEPLGGKPDASFHGKLLRYDVYLKKQQG